MGSDYIFDGAGVTGTYNKPFDILAKMPKFEAWRPPRNQFEPRVRLGPTSGLTLSLVPQHKNRLRRELFLLSRPRLKRERRHPLAPVVSFSAANLMMASRFQTVVALTVP